MSIGEILEHAGHQLELEAFGMAFFFKGIIETLLPIQLSSI